MIVVHGIIAWIDAYGIGEFAIDQHPGSTCRVVQCLIVAFVDLQVPTTLQTPLVSLQDWVLLSWMLCGLYLHASGHELHLH